MLIIKIKAGESIDSALKKFKNKVRKTKQIEELRANEFFQKPSEIKRSKVKKAKYVEKKFKQI